MTLSNDERRAVITFRKEKATKTLAEAKGIAELGFWNAVANRLYYACYYITSALLVKYKYNAQTHRGIINLLGMHFIRTGIVSKESGKFYSRLYELRQTGDYDDLFNLTKKDVEPLVKSAGNYIDEIISLIGD